jgi:thymidylate synthase (FAD)
MRIIKPYYQIETRCDGIEILKRIERAGRTCYKSEGNVTKDSATEFVRKIIQSGHESVIEHETITVRIICDRGVSHEIVRHRIGSYSQESTRYCNYSESKFDKSITVIEPCFWTADSPMRRCWEEAMSRAERAYLDLIASGASPQEARGVLPNSLKTEIVVTFNLRQWRHFLKVRTSDVAHPQMREITSPLLRDFKKMVPVVFDDIQPQ